MEQLFYFFCYIVKMIDAESKTNAPFAAVCIHENREFVPCIFKKQGFEFDTFSTDLYTGPKRHYYWDQFFVPDTETLYNWNSLIKEWVGYVTYAIMGYL